MKLRFPCTKHNRILELVTLDLFILCDNEEAKPASNPWYVRLLLHLSCFNSVGGSVVDVVGVDPKSNPVFPH